MRDVWSLSGTQWARTVTLIMTVPGSWDPAVQSARCCRQRRLCRLQGCPGVQEVATVVDSLGLLRLLSPRTLRVGGHFLELNLDLDGEIVGWRLLCGDCLAPRVTTELDNVPDGARPGLPVDGALRLPRTAEWPAATMAWGVVRARCDHSQPHPPATCGARPLRTESRLRDSAAARSQRCRAHRVVFGSGWRRSVESDPVLVPGGLWVSVAPGHATRVQTDAFGVRQVCRGTEPSWPQCPG